MCYLYLHWQISRTFGNALRTTIIYILPDFLFYFISVSVPMHYYLRQRPFWIISYSLSFTFEACNLHIKTLINSKVLMVSQWYIKLKYVGYRRSIARLWYLLPNVFFFIQNCIQISDIGGLLVDVIFRLYYYHYKKDCIYIYI